MSILVGIHDIDVDFVDELKTVAAIGIVFVENRFEQGIAFPV